MKTCVFVALDKASVSSTIRRHAGFGLRDEVVLVYRMGKGPFFFAGDSVCSFLGDRWKACLLLFFCGAGGTRVGAVNVLAIVLSQLTLGLVLL